MTLPLLPLATIFTSLVCNRFAVPNHPSYYKTVFPGGALSFDCCPFGYVFVQKACRCIRRDYVPLMAPRYRKKEQDKPTDSDVDLDWKVEVFPSEFVADENTGGEAVTVENIQYPNEDILQEIDPEFPDTNVGNSLSNLKPGRTNIDGNLSPAIAVDSVSSSIPRNPSKLQTETNSRVRKSASVSTSSEGKPQRVLGFGSFVPFYTMMYRYRNGRKVKMPIIYRYYRVLPRGSRRAIRLKNRRGFLVPIPVFIMASNGQFIYNPMVVRLYPAMLRQSKFLRQELIRLNSRKSILTTETSKSRQRLSINTINNQRTRTDSRRIIANRNFRGNTGRRQGAASSVSLIGSFNPRLSNTRTIVQNNGIRLLRNRPRMMTGVIQDPSRASTKITRIQFNNDNSNNNIQGQSSGVQARNFNGISDWQLDQTVNSIAKNTADQINSKNQINQVIKNSDSVITNHRDSMHNGSSEFGHSDKVEPSFTQLGINPNGSTSPLFLFGLNGVPIENIGTRIAQQDSQATQSMQSKRVDFMSDGQFSDMNGVFSHQPQSVIGVVGNPQDNINTQLFSDNLDIPFGTPFDPNPTNDGLFTFQGEDLGLFLDPTTNLPPGFAVNHGNVNQAPFRAKGILNPPNISPFQPSSASSADSGSGQTEKGTSLSPRFTPFTALSNLGPNSIGDIPNDLYDLLHDQVLLQNLNSIIAKGGNLDSLVTQSSADLKLPLIILETLTRKDVLDYLKWLLLYTQGVTSEKPPNTGEIPKALLDLLKHPDFLSYMERRRSETGVSEKTVINNAQDSVSTLINDKVSILDARVDKSVTQQNSSSDSQIEFSLNQGNGDLGVTPPLREWLSIDPEVKPTKQSIENKVSTIDVSKISSSSSRVTSTTVPTPTFKRSQLVDRSPIIMWKPSVRPPTPTIAREKLSIELCLGCKIDGGLGYTNHPTRCDLFVICYPSNNGVLTPAAMECPYGLFWSQSALTCKLSKDVHCPHEVCHNQINKYQYAHKGNCRAYWECHNGYSHPKCCPKNTIFYDGKGCVESTDSCKDVCPGHGGSTRPSWIGHCDKREIPGSPTKYERHAHQTLDSNFNMHGFNAWVVQECPPGTIFQREVCECSRAANQIPQYAFEGQECAPEVYLPFTDHLRDVSPGRTHVRAENVTRTAGTACFGGYSALAMPKFANMDLGTYLYIKIRYKQVHIGRDTEALLYNGDCDMKPSLVLGTKDTGNFLSVKTTTGEEKTMWTPSSASPTDWRTVTVLIDGGNVRMSTDQHSTTMKITGGIARSKCGMKIGWGEGYRHFEGCIDEFTLYRCRPDIFTAGR